MTTFVRPILITLALSLFPASAAFGASATGFIDFESQPVGTIVGNTLTINASGIPVTFSGLGLNIRQFNSPYPSTKVLSTSIDSEVITVTFGPIASLNYVEIENIINGRFNSETDVITGTAFNAANLPIDMATNSATIHRLNGPGIFKVLYDDDNVGGGYVIDNFRFEAVVPEPTTLLSAVCAAALAACQRRRCTVR